MGWLFGNPTDSDKASAEENANNASYKEGYDSGKNGDLLTDMAQYVGFFHIGTENGEQFDKGYEEGAKHRK